MNRTFSEEVLETLNPSVCMSELLQIFFVVN